MIVYKTQAEIEIMRANAEILGKTHAEVAKLIEPGVKTSLLNKVAEEYIKDNAAIPSFKGYEISSTNIAFPSALCISVNEQVVHGFPSDYELKEGDIISVDCGVFKDDFHSDSAYTYAVGEVTKEVQKLLEVTKQALYKGIEEAKFGARVGDISNAIQKYAESNGFSVVRELVGHGVGKSLHEKPEVPNYGKKGKGVMLKNGMVIAIEPMINMGRKEIVQEKDGWTIRTADKKPSAHFEHTVAINGNKADILTTFRYIEEVLEKKYGKANIY
ncbi:MAG: type I methionyl aminopeptidase [Thermonemataceae bacterium]|nr:type I methionyl aminopeptidase [Thermonemataceae bacterium]